MYGRTVGWLCFFLFFSTALAMPGDPISRVLSRYKQSDRLFHIINATPADDSTALAGFEEIINEVGKMADFAGKDTLLFQSWLKKAILLDSKSNYTGARDAYRQALGFSHPDDSLLFVTYINTGGVYYNLNHFDSASYFLLRADSMTGHFRGKEDEVRLYNTLGVLYFDNGNYRQGKNYFSRALEIVERKKPLDTASAASLQTNIATCFYHLEQYEEALAIYQKMLSYHMFSSYVYINMGNANINLHKYQEALACFRKVDAAKIPGVLNEMGYTQMKLNKPDSGAWFLDQLQLSAHKVPLNQLDLGTNHMYRADLLADRKEYMPALSLLQQAIIIFSRNFSNKDIYTNPTSFTGTFAYYRLFDALVKKAEVFRLLYKAQPGKEPFLEASYKAYQAALSLLRTIEKSYDTDDAKIFLKKKSGQAYEGALSVCLEFHGHHPEVDYVEQAFMISEKSKASIITANLEENAFAHAPGIDAGLLQNERNIKYNIARLNVRSEETTDKKEIEAIGREKVNYEIELSRLQKQLEQNGAYYKLKYQDSGPGVRELQRQLEGNQALISFYAGSGILYAFTVTSDGFIYTRIDSLSRIQQDAEAWLDALKSTGSGKKFKAGDIGRRLYQLLVKPLQQGIRSKDEWIIIPDGFLYFLPFESLPADEEGSRTLLETTTISYRFSSRLLTMGNSRAKVAEGAQILSFAPFSGGGQGSLFPALPASGEEIADLQGARYTNAQATKRQFLQEINKYPIVHLATHAISSPSNAAASFIAFYPVKHSTIEDCLFLEELYGLDMNATRLVIISACETGQGELVAKEGVISLSRAFAYAGCASTINSLWKADDKATSYILRRFYIHLKKGDTKARALQQAKLDYLASDAINKSPAFWAHLVLMGDTDPVYARRMGWLWTLALIPLVGGVAWMRRRKKKKSTFLKDDGI